MNPILIGSLDVGAPPFFVAAEIPQMMRMMTIKPTIIFAVLDMMINSYVNKI